MSYHPLSERLVEILCAKTQNFNPQFFRLIVAYYFGKMAATMRCDVETSDRGTIPINVYAVNLSGSGSGKGHSMNILEDSIVNGFRERFLTESYPLIAEDNLRTLAVNRARYKGVDPDEEFEAVLNEFKGCGEFFFGFDSGTAPALKQFRHKLLMGGIGSANFEIDEIGSNISNNAELLNALLELYDVGKTKTKLVKNTADSKRMTEIEGRTPANILMFGTPAKLLDGAKIEDEFLSFLETGYGRRCLFGYSKEASKGKYNSVADRLAATTNPQHSKIILDTSKAFRVLADAGNYKRVLTLGNGVQTAIIEYQTQCEEYAESLGEHEDIKKAEAVHRYFKALKLAGAYAFVDNYHEVTLSHWENAVKLVEDSGKAVQGLLTRERSYVKLAKYLSHAAKEVTQVDIMEDLPFFKGSEAARKDMLTMATAYGYKNNIIIKRAYSDGVEFISGESLQVNDLSQMIVSYSPQMAYDYQNETCKWEDLYKLCQAQDMNWINHHLNNGHRSKENCINGFNMVVLDVDGTVDMEMAKEILKEYTYLMYTTKRHTPQEHRFRIILPTSHTMKLGDDEYKEFMKNIYEFLPFESDDQTGQRARKWASYNSTYEYNDGALLDVLPYIPKTSKNDVRQREFTKLELGKLDGLERWFVQHTGEGNRSNQLYRYAMMFADSGHGYDDVRGVVLSLNSKLQDPLKEEEIDTTIMVSVANAIAKQE